MRRDLAVIKWLVAANLVLTVVVFVLLKRGRSSQNGERQEWVDSSPPGHEESRHWEPPTFVVGTAA
jgi:hypothetical protein